MSPDWLQHIRLWCGCQWYAAIVICRVSARWDPYSLLSSCSDVCSSSGCIYWDKLLMTKQLSVSRAGGIHPLWTQHMFLSSFSLFLFVYKRSGYVFTSRDQPRAINNLIPVWDPGCKYVWKFLSVVGSYIQVPVKLKHTITEHLFSCYSDNGVPWGSMFLVLHIPGPLGHWCADSEPRWSECVQPLGEVSRDLTWGSIWMLICCRWQLWLPGLTRPSLKLFQQQLQMLLI